MSSSKIPRGEFRNPCPDPKVPAAKTAVDSLLSTVTEAHKRFGDPTEDDYAVAKMGLGDLRQGLISRKLSVTGIVQARIRLTVQASLTTHCLTAFPYKKALEAAAFYDQDDDNDDLRKRVASYPLLGLVFSVKDCIHVEGHPTTLGCSSRAGRDERSTADLVQKMLRAGAIMIAKTTAPQLMMSNTTHSPLWGTTRSPLQPRGNVQEEFQVGGSSGGEASLVKMGGSQVGIGTDMGGSVRQPACLNELYGYKFASSPSPSKFTWRLPNDFMTGLPSTTTPATAPGLLARDIATLRLVAEEFHGDKYRNAEKLTSSDYEDAHEHLGNTPRIVYTAQHSSPEIRHLIHSLVQLLGNGDQLAHPSKCDELVALDLKAWGEAWTQHAKEHGFDDARAMLGDDPLISHTLFDESRLSSTATSNRDGWKPDRRKLVKLKDDLLRSAGIDSENNENIILITPTYILGGPVDNNAFFELDEAGESEIWCQIFNLLDWPAISIPIGDLPNSTRQELRDKSTAAPEWAKYLPSNIKSDPLDDNEEDERLPRLSLQLATTPNNALALLDYAVRITKANKTNLEVHSHATGADPDLE